MLFASLLAQSATNGQSVEVINEPCAGLGPVCDALLESGPAAHWCRRAWRGSSLSPCESS
jgi:hypothetical protein